MSTVTPALYDTLIDENRSRIKFNGSAKLLPAHDADPVCRRFLVPYDAAGNMPSGPIKTVAPPCEQRTPALILYQKVDINERRDAADKEKQFFRQSVCPTVDLALDPANQRRHALRWISQS